MTPLDVPVRNRSSDAATSAATPATAVPDPRLLALLAGPIPRWLPILLGFLTAVGPLSTDVYLPAFPALETSFGAPSGTAQITLATWFAGLACGQILLGPLCDHFGRRRPLMVGTVLFTAASIGCALSWSIASLAAFRFFAALGASASMVVPRAVVRDLRNGQDARRLMAQLILVMGAVPILAPSAGGMLLVVASWRVIFWVCVLYGLAALLLVWRVLPDTLPPDRRIDFHVERQLTRYVAILLHPAFITNALMGGLTMFGLFAYLGGSPVAYVREYGLTPPQYALAFSANAAVYIGAAQLSAPLAGRFGVDRLLRHATAVFVAAGLFLLAVALTRIGGLPMLLFAIGTNLFCMGIIGPIAPIAALDAHSAHAGSASALIGTMQFVLGAIATWLVGMLDDGTARPIAFLILAGTIGVKLAERLRPKSASPLT